MSLVASLSLSILKISGLISSAYISLMIMKLAQSGELPEIIKRQAFGFVMLFGISLLVFINV